MALNPADLFAHPGDACGDRIAVACGATHPDDATPSSGTGRPAA